LGGEKGIVTENPGIRLQSRESTTFQGEGMCQKKVKDHHSSFWPYIEKAG